MLSIKRALVIVAASLICGTQAGWASWGKGKAATPPEIKIEYDKFGGQIIHDQKVDIHNPNSILENEKVNLTALQEQFTKYSKKIYTPKSHNSKGKNAILNLKGDYITNLTQEIQLLNQEFLANSEYQFAEFIGLTMIQKVFDHKLESEEFVRMFENDTPHQDVLETTLVQTYQLVQEKIQIFSDQHKEKEEQMLKSLMKNFTDMLIEKEKQNGGFPDTEAMRTALFGQLAFKYEQQIQEIYKGISVKLIDQCSKDIDALLKRGADVDVKELEKQFNKNNGAAKSTQPDDTFLTK